MNGFDVVLSAIILIAVVIEAFRGFGRAVFDALGLYIALVIAHLAYTPLAGMVRLHDGAADNHAAVYSLCFGLAALIMLCISRFVYGAVHFDAGVFDKLLGVAAGIAIGLMVAHGITTGIALTDPTGRGEVASYTDTAFGDEMLNFTSYHRFLTTISAMGDNQRSDPTAG